MLEQLGKAGNGNDGRFEFVGKVVDEIRAQHFGVAQLLRHFVEALRRLREGGMTSERLAEMQPRVEVAGGKAVHLRDHPRDRLERQLHHKCGEHHAHHHADKRHKQQQIRCFQRLRAAGQQAEIGKDIHRDACHKNGNKQNTEGCRRK